MASLDPRLESVAHVGIATGGLARTTVFYRETPGMRVVHEEPRPGARGHRVAFLHPKAADGVLIELVEEHG